MLVEIYLAQREIGGEGESLVLWRAFGFMTVKSRIWWAFLTGTATKYRELALKSNARSFYGLISVWSNNITMAR